MQALVRNCVKDKSLTLLEPLTRLIHEADLKTKMASGFLL